MCVELPLLFQVIVFCDEGKGTLVLNINIGKLIKKVIRKYESTRFRTLGCLCFRS